MICPQIETSFQGFLEVESEEAMFYRTGFVDSELQFI